MLIIRGGIPRPIGDFPESLSQAILVGVMLVGRSGVREHLKRQLWTSPPSSYIHDLPRNSSTRCLHFSIRARHPCAGATLIFSASCQFWHVYIYIYIYIYIHMYVYVYVYMYIDRYITERERERERTDWWSPKGTRTVLKQSDRRWVFGHRLAKTSIRGARQLIRRMDIPQYAVSSKSLTIQFVPKQSDRSGWVFGRGYITAITIIIYTSCNTI